MTGVSKTATVLFTDLVGSTELTASLDAASAERVRARHFAALRGALAVHRGHEVKTLGDGFMASFESVTDGLACAVTMQRAVARENSEHSEARLAMRVGVATGDVNVAEGDLFGIPVIAASRLCAAAGPGQILTTDLVRMLCDGASHELESIGPLTLKGLPAPIHACELTWAANEDSSLRVALADDAVMIRQSIAQVLEAEGMEVVLEADDANALLDQLPAVSPHVVILDVRMPPTNTTEGLDAAKVIRAEHPGVGVLVLTADVHAEAARRLLENGTDGVGYLLKDRVANLTELSSAVRSIASGGSAIDPEIIGQLAA